MELSKSTALSEKPLLSVEPMDLLSGCAGSSSGSGASFSSSPPGVSVVVDVTGGGGASDAGGACVVIIWNVVKERIKLSICLNSQDKKERIPYHTND